MKNKLILLSTGLLFLALSSCRFNALRCIRGEGPTVTKTHSASGFHGVKISTDAEVNIFSDTAYSITIEGQQNIIENLNIRVSSGILIIDNAHCVSHKSSLRIEVRGPGIKDVDLAGSGSVNLHAGADHFSDAAFTVSGSGDLSIENNLLADDLETHISGSGKIVMDVNAKNIHSSISGSGKMTMNGSANSHHVKISGSGKCESYGLICADADIDISGSGCAYINCSNNLDANITGSGKIYYRGHPTVNTRISGSGKVINDN